MQQEPTIPQTPDSFTPTVTPLPEAPPSTPRNRGEGWRSVLSTILIVISAPIIALLLINFVFQSYEVDGPSMETTLQNADRLIVWKVPRTVARIRGSDYIPNRGDIIIFTKQGLYDGASGGEKQLIKRVIGLPGERVVVNDGKITVYNEELPNGFYPDVVGGYSDVIEFSEGNVDMTVGEGEVFVAGDNRANSLDSRSFGPISADDIIGKLEFRMFPFQNFQQF